jgi:plastocyanin
MATFEPDRRRSTSLRLSLAKETIMRTYCNRWLLAAFLLGPASALGANFGIGIGDDCVFPPGPRPSDGCFAPDALTIGVGDSVTFGVYADLIDTGPHNVVADDGSFRCARGCDGAGGDGTPADYTSQWHFTRTFNSPGVVHYHDEAGHASGVIVVQAVSPFAIGPGITGAWYDPAQSGHGLFIEVLTGNRFYASWFAFNPSGTGQAWITGVGTYSGDTATIPSVVMPTGGRWIPNFDPTQIVPNPWGTLAFTFTDCNHGRVDFNSIAGYGNGSMNLTRLTQPAGLTCP